MGWPAEDTFEDQVDQLIRHVVHVDGCRCPDQSGVV